MHIRTMGTIGIAVLGLGGVGLIAVEAFRLGHSAEAAGLNGIAPTGRPGVVLPPKTAVKCELILSQHGSLIAERVENTSDAPISYIKWGSLFGNINADAPGLRVVPVASTNGQPARRRKGIHRYHTRGLPPPSEWYTIPAHGSITSPSIELDEWWELPRGRYTVSSRLQVEDGFNDCSVEIERQ